MTGVQTCALPISRTIYVYDTIEADTIEDAYELIDNGDYDIDYRNGDAEDDVIIEPIKGA